MNVAVMIPCDEAARAALEAAAPDADIHYLAGFDLKQKGLAGTNPEALCVLFTADMVIGQPNVRWLPEMCCLRLLQLTMAGTEPYAALLDPAIPLCNASGAFGKAVSEHMLAQTLMLLKKLHLYRDLQAAHRWQDMGGVRSLSDMRVLCVGMGDIGGAYAQLCKQAGAYVAGVTRTRHRDTGAADAVYTFDGLDALLPEFDIVALSLPDTPQTRALMDARRLALMKADALLLNVGRGSAVDADALAAALQAGRLGGAALDVTEPEPLPAAHALWDCENALITPHISGFFHLYETYTRIIGIAAENLRRLAAGEPPINAVDRATGYRATLQA